MGTLTTQTMRTSNPASWLPRQPPTHVTQDSAWREALQLEDVCLLIVLLVRATGAAANVLVNVSIQPVSNYCARSRSITQPVNGNLNSI